MKKVGPVIEKMLRSYNLWEGYQQYQVVESWSKVVGPELSAVTCADSIAQGILKILVKDSVWAYHLSMLKPRLIKKINKNAGKNVVKDIFFQIDDLNNKRENM